MHIHKHILRSSISSHPSGVQARSVMASWKQSRSTTTGRGLSVRHTVTTPSALPRATALRCLVLALGALTEDEEEAAAAFVVAEAEDDGEVNPVAL